MRDDDFLMQFRQNPPDDFANELLENLKQLDEQSTGIASTDNEPEATPAKQPIMLVPAPRTRPRTVDRYLTAIVSAMIVLAVSSIVFVTLNRNEIDNTTPADSIALPVATADGLTQLAWSPDGNHLYVADAEHLYLLDSRLQLIESIPLSLNGFVTAMTFVDDGAILAIGDSNGAITLWSTDTHELLHTEYAHRSRIQVLLPVERSHRLLSAGLDSDLVVFDVRNDILFELDRLTVSQESLPMFVSGLTVSPDGSDVIASMNNSATFIYELEANGELHLSQDDFSLASMPPTLQSAYAVNGQNLTYIWWDSLVVLDSHTLNERYHYTLPERFQWLSPLQMSDDGRRVLISNNRSSIALWDFSSETYIPIFQVSRALNHDVYSVLHPDGHLVAAIMQRDEVHLWQINPSAEDGFDVLEVAVNRPGVNRSNRASEIENLHPISTGTVLDLEELFSFGDGFLTHVLWSPDGNRLIVTGTGTIRVYDAELNLLREWSLVGSDVVATSISQEGRYLVTASSNGTMAIREIATGRLIASLSGVHDNPVELLTFVDGQSRIVSRDKSGDFALLQFDGTNLELIDRFESGALQSYNVVDWYVEGDNLRLLMMRDVDWSYNDSELINIVDFDLTGDFEAQTTTTAIYGTFGTFSEDGDSLLVYDRAYDTVSAYDSYSFDLILSTPVPETLLSAVHMQRDHRTGNIFLIDYDNELYIYDSVDEIIYQVEETNALLEQPSAAIALHPATNRLAIIISHNQIAVSEIVERNGRHFINQIATDTPVLGQIQTFITGPDNVAAATTTDGSVLFFDTITGNLLRRVNLSTWGTRNHDVIFNRSGTMLVVLGHDITGFDAVVNILDVQAIINGDDDVHLSDSPYIFEREYLSGMAFSSQNDRLITGGSQVRSWNLNDEPFEYVDVYDLHGLTIFAYNPGDEEVATLRPGNYLRVVDVDNMLYRYSTRIYNRSSLSGTYLEYTPDGNRIIMADDEQPPEIYDPVSGNLLLTLTGSSNLAFADMTIGHDGSYLLMADDYGLFMWDIENAFNGDTVPRQLDVDFAVRQIAISSDGTRLFLVAQDGTIHVMGIPQN